MAWQNEARQLREQGIKWQDIWLIVKDKYDEYISLEMVKKLGYKSKPKIKTEPKPKKFVAVQHHEPTEHKMQWNGCQEITFGLMGDTQIGSKYAQITLLHKFYDLCQQRGIKTVYHTGDITDGLKMRPGHEYELDPRCISVDGLMECVEKVYPRREGMTTYFITGNHDASLYKLAGYDIGSAIAKQREDMIYLGRDCADVKLTPNCTLRLQHNWDGSAYSISYKPQKVIEAMDGGNKPNILALGHYHKVEYLFYRNVNAFQTGCFQAATPFTRGKGISVHMGAWIVTVMVAEDGSILRIMPEMFPYYNAIKDDYKSW